MSIGHRADLEAEPALVIFRAYNSVERFMHSIIKKTGIKKAEDLPDLPGFYAYTLMQAGLIDRDTMDLISRLRKLRDEVVTWQVRADKQAATDYYFATRKVLSVIGPLLSERLAIPP